ncbi:MAG: hypothetical protein JJ896_06210 [Rhodothermales bacterium]|nr:hypothetical protein [Rhodothermales bacterium]MBO6779227.1 hypothetical protein [Rhodothermales bacterium]
MSDSQNYANHRRFVPMYHYFLALLVLATVIGSVVNLIRVDGDGLYSATLILALSVGLLLAGFYARVFALKVQDRVIRTEERLRHQELTGTPLNGNLTMRQIIGLRFASDEEFPELAARAAAEGTSEDDIKKAIKSWRADNERA